MLIWIALGLAWSAHAAGGPVYSRAVVQKLAKVRRLERKGDPAVQSVPEWNKTLADLQTLARHTVPGIKDEMDVNAAANQALQTIKARARRLAQNPNPKIRWNVLSALIVDDRIQPIGSVTMNLPEQDRKIIASMAFDPEFAVRRRAVNLLWSIYQHDKELSFFGARYSYSKKIIAVMQEVREKERDAEIKEIAEEFWEETHGLAPCNVVLGED